MCAGAHNIQTVVAGQVFYTLGNAGISFCRSSSLFIVCISRSYLRSEQFAYRRYHLYAMASLC